jgi:hypothetical protein
MRPDPFCDPGDDGQEPDSSLSPAGWDAGPDTDADAEADAEAQAEPGQQGLFLCLPAGSLDTDQFAQCGPAPDMPPDPLLATVVDTVTGEDRTGLGGLSDDQLVGVIAAGRRLESRAAWYVMAAVAEFAARHDREPCGAEFAADQLAFELHLTRQSAAAQLDYTRGVAGRLPTTFAALHAGAVHPVHVRIIEEETAVLSAADAAKADAVLAEVAGSLTFGKLRATAHKLVLELDPEAAERRKQAARQDAHVRPFPEPSGNAGMVARELPPDEVLASWQHVQQRALDLRAAGVPGTLQELRVRAYLDLLQERDSRPAPPDPDSTETPTTASPDGTGTSATAGPDDTGEPATADPDDAGGPGDDGPSEPGRSAGGPGRSAGGPGRSAGGPGRSAGGPGRSAGGPGRGPASSPGSRARRPGSDAGPSFAALINITVPWSTLTGQSVVPGDVAGLGLADAADARDLVAAAARDPRTRWCVTALHPDGTAVAHGCVPGRHPPPGTANLVAGPGPPPGPDPPPGTRPQDWLRVRLTPIARGGCGHDRAEPGYRPSRTLRHLVQVRNARCTAPGCGRPAARCDLDHTIPWDQGGLTCECDLAPLCRHHHRAKQAEGWHLEQPEPGVLIWRTPADRTYATGPTQYPV